MKKIVSIIAILMIISVAVFTGNVYAAPLNSVNVETSKDLVRPGIENATNHEDAADNVTDKTEQEITSLQEEREQYVESLGY